MGSLEFLDKEENEDCLYEDKFLVKIAQEFRNHLIAYKFQGLSIQEKGAKGEPCHIPNLEELRGPEGEFHYILVFKNFNYNK